MGSKSKRCPTCGHHDVDESTALHIMLVVLLLVFALGYGLGVIAAFVGRGGM